MVSSPELAGGKGFTFEDVAVAHYLLALLAKETAPGLNGHIATRIAQQRRAFGDPLDDLIVDATSVTAGDMRLSLQVKSAITVSAARTNTDFRNVVTECGATITKPEFRMNRDRVGVVTGSIAEASRRALATVAEWARESTDNDSFFARFEQQGFAGEDKKNVLAVFKEILPDASNADIHNLLRHFVIVRFDALHEGATDDAAAVTLARRVLDPTQTHEAENLWIALKQIARDGAGHAAQNTRTSLLTKLSGRFQFTPAPSLNAAIARITEEAKLTLAAISNQIDGTTIARPKIRAKFEEVLADHAFVQIVGLPGTGKSGALRTLAQDYFPKGNLIALKTDRIAAASWHAYAQSIGMPSVSIEDLLVEIGATGTPILFIDGLDRLAPAHKSVVLDLILTIIQSPSLKHWKIVATLRDNGIEPVRTWLPPALFRSGGVGTVEVTPFDDEEAEALAALQPSLQPLLFGGERVREIARRPFFASVLLRSMVAGQVLSPKSEVELSEAWWARGGYDAGSGEEVRRQRALLDLALRAGRSLGDAISLESVDTEAVQALILDGIVRKEEAGHSIQFTHDIFFEWAFFHLLVDRRNAWPELIAELGELPGLARPVELLSQREFIAHDTWEGSLLKLEESKLRAQWQRAWLLAPFGTPAFVDRAANYTAAILKPDTARLARVVVWYQAEKTRPNPTILASSQTADEESRRQMLRTADALAWPSDVSSWRRFCTWLLELAPQVPIKLIPDAVTAFSVWQNIAFNVPNAVSTAIFQRLVLWLESLENQIHSHDLKWDAGGWNQLSRADLKELESSLRSEVFRSVGTQTDGVSRYLKRIAADRWIRDSAFRALGPIDIQDSQS
jgi:ATPase family associated with various cellular activities (AAA)